MRPSFPFLLWAAAAAAIGLACRAGAQAADQDLDALAAALESGRKTAQEILIDPALMSLHSDTRLRDLMRRHAPAGRLTLAAPEEAGERLIVEGIVRDAVGRPVAAALFYVFQADRRGFYTPEKTMDEPHARLFGYLHSGPDGRFEIRTIRPGGYPAPVRVDGEERQIPEHIHIVISAPGFRERRIQLYFADDPRVAPPWVAPSAARNGFPILAVSRSEDGVQRCTVELRLEQS